MSAGYAKETGLAFAVGFVTINQTTAGITLTLPAPTNTQAGRMLDIMNSGSQSVTVGGQLLAPGTGLCFIWTGTAWGALGSPVSLDWKLTGNSGTVNTAYNDGGAQANNFIGTLDNIALSLYTNASNANAKSDLKLYPTTVAGAVVAAATDILHIRRGGQAGVVWPQVMSVALGHWLADGNSRTRADFRLGNGGVNVPDFTLMSLFSQGGVGINGNGGAADWSWTATGGGIGRGNGGALLGLMGANGSNNVGPHIGVWTAADTFPVYYQLNWQHDNVSMLFDGYFDGAWKAAHTTRPYGIYKNADRLNFYGQAAAPGAAGSAWAQDMIMALRYAGATLAGGELWFNNVAKNRRIVLWDGNAASDHQYYGLGINASTFRYQVDSVNSAHRFYAGTAAATSQELIAFLGNRQIDVQSALILRPVTIADLAANGAVGTAAATVDVASTLVLSQATANIALTLPNPTNAQAGRMLFVTHNGTAATTVASRTISPGETLSFIWDGNTWNPPAYVPPTTRAYVYATSAGAAVNNAVATLANWTETADAGNNHAAGVFTAPRSGLYQVNAMVTYTAAAWNATTYAQITVQVNGADRHQGTTTVEAAGNKIVSVSVGATVQLTAGQTIQINLYQNSGAAKTPAGGINSYYTIVEL